MKQLRSGDRRGSLGIVLGLVAVMAACLGVILFVVDLRTQVDRSHDIAERAVQSEEDLRATIMRRCKDRQAYDQRFVRAAEGDEKFYADLLSLAERAEKVRTEPLPPAMQKLVDEQVQMIADARDRKRAIVAEGVLGNCGDYAPPPASIG